MSEHLAIYGMLLGCYTLLIFILVDVKKILSRLEKQDQPRK